MSALSTLRQLDTSDPEKLKRDLARLVDILDRELDRIEAGRLLDWSEVTALQRGDVTAKMGQLVRLDTTANQPAPHVYLPEAKTADIGKKIGVAANSSSPTCVPVVHGAGGQKISFTGTVATLVASTLAIRSVTWTGPTWEVGY
jgi:hypothetical protein